MLFKIKRAYFDDAVIKRGGYVKLEITVPVTDLKGNAVDDEVDAILEAIKSTVVDNNEVTIIIDDHRDSEVS